MPGKLRGAQVGHSTEVLTAAFLTDAPRIAGSEVWLRDLLPLLPANGVQATLFLPRRDTLETFAAQVEQAGVDVRWYDHLLDLPALTQGFDVRVVQAWEPSTYQTLLPALASPRVVVSHDQLDYHYTPPLRALYREIYRFTKARSFAQADGVITVSAWAADFLSRTMKVRNVQGMTNGVDTGQFHPGHPAERQKLRQAFDFRRFTVIVPGRFTLEKNQLTAVLTAKFAPEIDFVFVGDMDSGFGRLAQALKASLGLRNVRFLGRRHDMPELYRAADVLLQPTLAENQSLVTLEAMSSGLPVVTTRIPAQTEIVQDGVHGLCLPAQPEVMARALQALARHPERTAEMGRNARQYIQEKHVRQHSAAQLAQLLLSVTTAR